MFILWVPVLVAGVVVAALASRRAVNAALETVDALGMSEGFVGITVLAIGTDLPEIANSIMASLTDHGDVNVGDSTGSALTQVTMILAILIVVAGLSSDFKRDELQIVVPAGLMSVGALVLLAVLLADEHLSRWNGLTMVGAWVLSILVLHRRTQASHEAPRIPDGRVGGAILATLFWLLIVGGAAVAIVRSFVEITDAVGVPEFIASTIVLAIGTSVPELVVDWVAIKRGAAALALGDLFGATLIDSTLSVGSGPIFRGTAVSPETLTGVLLIAVGIGATTVIVATVRRRSLVSAGQHHER
uniref:sodium:calcium antiporter n=1 Tax=Ilumatobacter sp. TaxID=1967498 RepID=UPI002606A439